MKITIDGSIDSKIEISISDYTDEEKEMLKLPNGISVINETAKEILREYCRTKKEMYDKKCDTLIKSAEIVRDYISENWQQSQALKDREENLQKESDIHLHGCLVK